MRAMGQTVEIRTRARRLGSEAVLSKLSRAPASRQASVAEITQATCLTECRAEVCRLLRLRMRFKTARSHREIRPARRFIPAQMA